jgi:hypothetical protein
MSSGYVSKNATVLEKRIKVRSLSFQSEGFSAVSKGDTVKSKQAKTTLKKPKPPLHDEYA